mmetsp:Transcript_4367/g.17169  ORF Transcript_4367/g.17169 Transcript_4367/m.17169 type:complete len:210 (-) Transcript_4367:38-667(-)
MYRPTAMGAFAPEPNTTNSSPKVATISPIASPAEVRTFPPKATASSSNMECASIVPATPPKTCALQKVNSCFSVRLPSLRNTAKLTIGLKCAELMGPNTVIPAYKMPQVATALPSNATPALSRLSWSAWMPEPTTVATRSIVPRNSATAWRPSSTGTASTRSTFSSSATRSGGKHTHGLSHAGAGGAELLTSMVGVKGSGRQEGGGGGG